MRCVAVFGMMGLMLSGFAANAESYYEILDREYKSSRTPAAFEDFDRPGFPRQKMCVEVGATTANEAKLVQLMVVTRTSEGRGPLLPGQTEHKLIYSAYGEPNMDPYVDSVTSQVEETRLVSVRRISANSRETVRVRKSEDLLVFERIEKLDRTNSRRYVGYCYPVEMPTDPVEHVEPVEPTPEPTPEQP